MQCLTIFFSVAQFNWIEPIEDLMFNQGAHAVTLEDAKDVPLFEPKPGEVKLWPENKLTAWFDEELDLAPLCSLIQKDFQGLSLQVNQVDNQDWEKNLHAHFKPVFFGQRLCICPSWETPPQ